MNNLKPYTERVRRRFLGHQRIRATPGEIFPLLCPVREYDWIPEWSCRVVYTESGLAEPGGIFQTDRDADDGLDTWVVSRHEPNRCVAFVRVNHLRAIQYEILLDPIDADWTALVWSQVVTALSDAGDQHVAALREDDFVRGIAKLETLMSDYLAGQTALDDRS